MFSPQSLWRCVDPYPRRASAVPLPVASHRTSASPYVQDAFSPLFASAGALVCVNASAGAAAASAPSHAFAAHQLACPWTPRYHTLGEPS